MANVILVAHPAPHSPATPHRAQRSLRVKQPMGHVAQRLERLLQPPAGHDGPLPGRAAVGRRRRPGGGPQPLRVALHLRQRALQRLQPRLALRRAAPLRRQLLLQLRYLMRRGCRWLTVGARNF